MKFPTGHEIRFKASRRGVSAFNFCQRIDRSSLILTETEIEQPSIYIIYIGYTTHWISKLMVM